VAVGSSAVRFLAVVFGCSRHLAVRTPLRWAGSEPSHESHDCPDDEDPSNCEDHGVHVAVYPSAMPPNRFCSRRSGYAFQMDRHPDKPQEVPGRADRSAMRQAPHSVIASVADLDQARRLIEDLENHGIPTPAIALLGAKTKDPDHADRESDVAESDAFAQLAKSVIIGGMAGILVGAMLGLLLASVIADLATGWGLVMGGVFGAGVGGAAGGISVAKYSSPAWDETYQVEEAGDLAVGIHHVDQEVVDRAEEIIGRHRAERVVRPDRDDE
jgi:F0F1-type ATP synthase assembly protein I